MKKKRFSLLVAVCVMGLVLISAIGYVMPRCFLRGLTPSDVSSISVFDGNTGKAFEIRAPEDIRHIVENIQACNMKKEKLSLGYSGYGFRLYFYGEDGKELECLIINSDRTLRKDPFFYSCEGYLCFDYLKEREERKAH